MSGPNIFRVIDVLAEAAPEQGAWTSAVGETERPVTTTLTGWSDAAPSVALERRRQPMVRVGYVPCPTVPDPRHVMLDDPASERARSYRLLRHRLLSHRDPRVIAVTSARPGEGKTTCALNLALALAEDTMVSVLLLEANLRRPAVGKALGFETEASFLFDMIRFTHAGPPYSVVGLSGARLHVAALPSAPIQEGHLQKTLFSAALLELRAVYDYVIIDAASVLESGDADVIGECADGVLLAVRGGVSRKADLRRAIDQLRPTPMLGSVLLDA